ncbi:MORN repeat protein [Ichthyophthirius multifiliis]|uniref:MORN repeat protein n=1 Tax=Ichthyophthirius multifiliis TaxID=5932 RepID=G0QQN4_ICHMU|nr:MORN repeat protein [Ichthyophthirius multifiliis]EGR32466.1 MORN repeat protein [Ichthyophthirius multifiliis]|eukprot:XP_004036452.1 MORN repeat protein [Ichthyophthirius multifiliis]
MIETKAEEIIKSEKKEEEEEEKKTELEGRQNTRNFEYYFDESDKIIENKLENFQREIILKARIQKKAPVLNPDGSYTLYSGMLYFGEFDPFYQRTGPAILKDKDYFFEGIFQNDFPTGKGKEIRNNIIYEGYFLDGFYDGEGVLLFPNGRKYSGSFKKHQFHGKGELLNDDGVIFAGNWVNGSLQIGIIKYHDGSYYTGGLKYSFLKHGKGQFFNYDAFPLYDGKWVDDRPKTGKIYNFWDYGVVLYEGEFENYAIQGQGDRVYKEGTYKGHLFRDNKQGKGEFFYKDGSKYEGEWVNDMQFKGTFYYNINDQEFNYKGEWKNGQQEGYGKHQYPSGGIYEGYFKAGKRHGFGIYNYSNGNKYQGNWQNNQQEGDGKFIFIGETQGSQGDVYKGQFKQGKFQGFGHYLYRKQMKTFTGFWENDTWKGKGIIKSINNNTILKCGVWENEKFINEVDEKELDFPENWQKYTNLNE